jgi:hypothetical protein
MKSDPDKIIMTVAEFLSGAQTSDLVAKESAEDERDAKIRDSRARRDEEWSLLANQVVGGEGAIFPDQTAACAADGGEAPKSSTEGVPPSKCCGGASSS